MTSMVQQNQKKSRLNILTKCTLYTVHTGQYRRLSESHEDDVTASLQSLSLNKLSDMDVILFKSHTTGLATMVNGDFHFHKQNCSSLKAGRCHSGLFTLLSGC